MTRALLLWLYAWLSLVLLSALCAVLPLGWGTWVAAPDVPFIVVLFFALQARDSVATTTAFAVALGYLADLFCAAPVGLHMLASGLSALGIRLAASRLLVRGWLATTLVGLGFSFIHCLIVAALRATLEPEIAWETARQLPLGALSSALVTYPLFRQLARIERRFVRDQNVLGLR